MTIYEIASLRPANSTAQGFARNDSGPLFVIARSGATKQSPSRISYGL